MSLNFNAWMGSDAIRIDAETRAILAYARILDKPDEVSFYRDGVDIAAQTVRIDPTTSASQEQLPGGDVSRQRVTLLGIRQHPTLDDTDMRVGDRFWIGSVEYEIVFVSHLPGEVQGIAEAQV